MPATASQHADTIVTLMDLCRWDRYRHDEREMPPGRYEMPLPKLLNTLVEPRLPRRYVGRHRAPEHMRYVAVARVSGQPALPPS
jgi:hypothetical protein